MSSTGRGGRRSARDYYVTPEWVIGLLANGVLIRAPEDGYDYIVDLGAADGRIAGIVSKRLLKRSDSQIVLVDVLKRKRMHHSLVGRDMRQFPNGIGGSLYRRFLKACQLNGSKILFVSNPPFTWSLEFVKDTIRAMEGGLDADSEAWFNLPLNWLGSLKRASFLNECPPTEICTIVPRPSYTGGGTDSNEYAWMRWQHSSKGVIKKPFRAWVDPRKVDKI